MGVLERSSARKNCDEDVKRIRLDPRDCEPTAPREDLEIRRNPGGPASSLLRRSIFALLCRGWSDKISATGILYQPVFPLIRLDVFYGNSPGNGMRFRPGTLPPQPPDRLRYAHFYHTDRMNARTFHRPPLPGCLSREYVREQLRASSLRASASHYIRESHRERGIFTSTCDGAAASAGRDSSASCFSVKLFIFE